MDNKEQLKKMYGDQLTANLAGMRGAYKQGLSKLNREADKLPSIYRDARNQTAATSAIERRNFDERAAANGLNTGAGGMAQLSMSNAYQNALAGLREQQRADEAQIQAQRNDMRTDYLAAVQQAKAQNSSALNQALYQERLRAQAEAQRRKEREEDRAEREAARAAAAASRSYGGGSGSGGSGSGSGGGGNSGGGGSPSGITYGKGAENFDARLRTVASLISQGRGAQASQYLQSLAQEANEAQAAQITQMMEAAKKNGLLN